MNSPTLIRPAATVRNNHPTGRPNLDKVEWQFCKVSALIAFYDEVHSLCCIVLALTIAGTLLYGVGLLLCPWLGKGS